MGDNEQHGYLPAVNFGRSPRTERLLHPSAYVADVRLVRRSTAMEDAELGRLLEEKCHIRRTAAAARQRLPDKDHRSDIILARAAALPQYKQAVWVMFYVDHAAEVRTRPLISQALSEGKQVVVPYCHGNNLDTFLLADLSELQPGMLGILEPAEELRHLAERRVPPESLQVIFVPGVAFDRRGGRIGHGKGYYDRFLAGLPSRVLRLGLAFQCQVVAAVPMLPWDAPVDAVITEEAIYWAARQETRNGSGDGSAQRSDT